MVEEEEQEEDGCGGQVPHRSISIPLIKKAAKLYQNSET